MPDHTPSETNLTLAGKFRRVGLIFRITACVFAAAAMIYAVNVFRHEDAEFDIAMSVLHFALAIVFFLIGASYYRKANAGYDVPTDGIRDK